MVPVGMMILSRKWMNVNDTKADGFNMPNKAVLNAFYYRIQTATASVLEAYNELDALNVELRLLADQICSVDTDQ